VREGVVLDLRYEARDIDQSITSQAKIDQWFEAKTKGLNDLAKAQLKQKWGTMQRVLSSQDRLEEDRGRHPDGHGDQAPPDGRPRQRHAGGRQHLRSLQVLRAVRQDRAQRQMRHRDQLRAQREPTPRAKPRAKAITDNLLKYAVYSQMLADWFNEPPDKAINKAEKFELEVKKKFIDRAGPDEAADRGGQAADRL
jgi:type I restriction enzyme R subunit